MSSTCNPVPSGRGAGSSLQVPRHAPKNFACQDSAGGGPTWGDGVAEDSCDRPRSWEYIWVSIGSRYEHLPIPQDPQIDWCRPSHKPTPPRLTLTPTSSSGIPKDTSRARGAALCRTHSHYPRHRVLARSSHSPASLWERAADALATDGACPAQSQPHASALSVTGTCEAVAVNTVLTFGIRTHCGVLCWSGRRSSL